MNEKRELIQKETTQIIVNNKKGLYHISPRVGKTKIVIDAIKYFSTRNILISVPYESLIDNWKREFVKWGESSLNNVQYICHSSLDKFSRKGEDFVPDILIIDEIHLALSFNRLNAIRRFNSERLIGLSGSLGQKHIKLLKENLGLNVLYEYSVDESVEDNIIKDYEIHVHKVPLNTTHAYKKRWKNSKQLLTEEQLNLQLSSEVNEALSTRNPIAIRNASIARAQFLYNIKSKNEKAIQLLNKCTDRCIIFSQLSAVADSICEHSYHSKSRDNNLELFLEEKIQKLSVVNMADVGITFPNLNKAIVISMQSSEDKAIQRILRTMTLDENHPKARIDIFISKNTQEEKWCKNALSSLNQSKIIYHD